MARNTTSLLNSNPFKQASTTQEALIILVQKTDRLRNLANSLADNDVAGDTLSDAVLSRVSTVMNNLSAQLASWLALPNQ